jgi:hypothetical protein
LTYFADLNDYTDLPIGEASRLGTKNVGWLCVIKVDGVSKSGS